MNPTNLFDDSDESDKKPSSSVTARSLRERTLRQLQSERRVKKLISEAKFLNNFDPEKSSRERRKLTRQSYTTTKRTGGSLFDEKGRYRHNLADVCDCLDNFCPGCHFPCPNCASCKCATTCRANRKWAFEIIEHDGKDLVVKNKHYTPNWFEKNSWQKMV